MKVNVSFGFSEPELRTIRAAHGRGGVATRAECRTFIDRAVRAALKAAPDPRPKRVARPKPAPAPPPAELPEGSKEAETRARLRRLYRLTGGAGGNPVIGED